MDFALLSPAVVVTASATLAVTTAWRWFIDWRQARFCGVSAAYVRSYRRWRRHALARVRALRIEAAIASRGDDWTPPAQKILAPRVQSPPVGHAVGVQDLGCRVPVFSLGPTTVQHWIAPLTAETHKAPVSMAVSLKTLAAKDESKAASPDQFARLFLAPKEQVAEFLSAEAARHRRGQGKGSELRRDKDAWCEAYRRWATTNAIGPVLPDCMFLKELNRADAITKSRPRRKDAFGRVLKTPGGTPERDTVYDLSLSELEAAERARNRAARQAARRTAKADEEAQQFGIAA